MTSLLSYLPGHWSRVLPAESGVYAMRDHRGTWISHWSRIECVGSRFIDTGESTREFFYLRGDEPGKPTRWDDARIGKTAEANGWRETRSKWT